MNTIVQDEPFSVVPGGTDQIHVRVTSANAIMITFYRDSQTSSGPRYAGNALIKMPEQAHVNHLRSLDELYAYLVAKHETYYETRSDDGYDSDAAYEGVDIYDLPTFPVDDDGSSRPPNEDAYSWDETRFLFRDSCLEHKDVGGWYIQDRDID